MAELIRYGSETAVLLLFGGMILWIFQGILTAVGG